MLTLIGSVLGFFSSLTPEFMKLFQDKMDKKHELEVMKLQMQVSATEHGHKLSEINATADISESSTLNQRVNPIGIRWIDALRGSVRPIITYLFFALYGCIKLVTLYQVGLDSFLDTPWRVWTVEDQIIFATIISFWFGSRHMHRMRSGQHA